MSKTKHPPIHLWTHDGNKVLLVKMIDKDRKTGGGNYPVIEWPESGMVKCDDWKPKARCGHGIHAWPWGMSVGEGKNPDATTVWLVLAVDPDAVVKIGGKVKVPEAEVVHNGTMASAMCFTQAGRIAWIVKNSGSSAQTGYGGSSAQTGNWGSSAQTGDKGSSAQTGDGGSSAQTGDGGSSAQTGDGGSSAQTGDGGSSAQTGYGGSSAQTGDGGSSAQTGDGGSSAQTGNGGSSAQTGDGGSSAQTGYGGSSAQTGNGGSSAQTGYGGSSAQTGNGGSSAQTGYGGSSAVHGRLSIASMCGEHGTIEVSSTSIGAVQSEEFNWVVHIGAVIIQRWENGDSYPFAVLDSVALKLEEGQHVVVIKGVVQK